MRSWRIQQDEYPYHIVTRTNGRKFLLTRPTYEIFVAVLIEAIHRFAVHIHHVKLMDNHYHLIMSTPHANLSAAMQFINYQLARRINKLYGTTGHLWGQRFHATIIETDAYAHTCVRYLYQNGVRAGLCRTASEDPRLSSYAFYAEGAPNRMVVEPDDFYLKLGENPVQRQTEFRNIVDTPLMGDEVQRTHQGLRRLFFGSSHFVRQMNIRYASHIHRGRTP